MRQRTLSFLILIVLFYLSKDISPPLMADPSPPLPLPCTVLPCPLLSGGIDNAIFEKYVMQDNGDVPQQTPSLPV